jgi:hypothetical protein
VSPDELEPVHPLVDLTDAQLAALLKRSAWMTGALGAVIAVVLCFAMGWRDGALFAVGAGISAASVYEWLRLIRLFNARLDQQKLPRGAALVVSLFLVRLVIFAGLIYGSLKCFHGSPIALLCGLALALVWLVWEALRMLKG